MSKSINKIYIPAWALDGKLVLTIAATAADLGVINDLGWSKLLANDVPITTKFLILFFIWFK